MNIYRYNLVEASIAKLFPLLKTMLHYLLFMIHRGLPLRFFIFAALLICGAWILKSWEFQNWGLVC